MAAQLEFDIADRDGNSDGQTRQIVGEKILAGLGDAAAIIDRSSFMIIIRIGQGEAL